MGLFCWKKCQERRIQKLQIRQEQKTARKIAKYEERTERTFLRQEPKIAAINAGIDPNASKWTGLASMVGSVTSIFGGSPGTMTMDSNSGSIADNKTLLWIAAGVLALIILRK